MQAMVMRVLNEIIIDISHPHHFPHIRISRGPLSGADIAHGHHSARTRRSILDVVRKLERRCPWNDFYVMVVVMMRMAFEIVRMLRMCGGGGRRITEL